MRIVIIGGGIAGCSLALKLANAGHQVTLLESKKELLSGSSDSTPCRLGLGFHYSDKETAIKYLRSTLDFIKEYGSVYIVGHSEEKNHPLRRGRYFIVNNSLFDPGKVLNTYEIIRDEYAKLVEADPSNAIFGDPKNFYNVLALSKYKEQVNSDKVTVGIETAEQILDWPRLKSDLIQQMHSHQNITVKTSSNVQSVKDDLGSGFVVKVKKNNQLLEEKADFVVNAAWQNAEALSYQSGYVPSSERTNRLKVIIEVELPPELVNANSMFFCFGPHCAFNNTGNCRGFISYEPVTNIGHDTGILFPKNLQKYLDGDVSDMERKDLAGRIIAGVAQYIPAIAKAKFTGIIKFGVVKIYGKVCISDPNSGIHQRRESGVEEEQVGVVKNSAMKLLYGAPNADEVMEIIKKHTAINRAIKEISDQVFPLSEKTHSKVLNHTLTKMMQRYWTFSSSAKGDKNSYDAGNLKKVVANKQAVTQQLTQFFKPSSNPSSPTHTASLSSSPENSSLCTSLEHREDLLQPNLSNNYVNISSQSSILSVVTTI